jgi:hypothetical protein
MLRGASISPSGSGGVFVAYSLKSKSSNITDRYVLCALCESGYRHFLA